MMEVADRKEGPMTLTISAAGPVIRRNFPGVLLSATIGAAAAFLGSHYGAPVMLFALLLGIAAQSRRPNFGGSLAAC